MLDASQVRNDFPIFSTQKSLVYLDSAATSQKPKSVLDAMYMFYAETNANPHRGIYKLSQQATTVYDDARSAIAKHIGASTHEIICTRGTTESLNALAYTLPLICNSSKTEIVVTAFEHHANLVPWQQAAQRHGMKLKVIAMKNDFTLDYADAEQKITEKTAIVACTHVSNALGTIVDITKLCNLAQTHGAYSVIDAAQSVGHMLVDVTTIGCDFLAFSGHKVLGPMGIGVLYGREALLKKMPPFLTGGDMIQEVTYDSATWNTIPMKFEAGTPNVAGATGLHEAIQYINELSIKAIHEHEQELRKYALEKLSTLKDIIIYAPEKGAGIISFNLANVHPHDASSLLDDTGICVRAGHHCTMPLMKHLGIPGTLRISFHVYTTKKDIDLLLAKLIDIQKRLG